MTEDHDRSLVREIEQFDSVGLVGAGVTKVLREMSKGQ